MVQINWKIIKFLHGLLWVVWALLTLTYRVNDTGNIYGQLFGSYMPYDFFYWFELVFMFGGGLLLLAWLINLLPSKLSFLGYVIFELIFIGIIVIHLIVYFHQ